jgi:hypothetical protein
MGGKKPETMDKVETVLKTESGGGNSFGWLFSLLFRRWLIFRRCYANSARSGT